MLKYCGYNNISSNLLTILYFHRIICIFIHYTDKSTGDAQGWWKACNSVSNKIGYIPKDFVKVIQPSQTEAQENPE